MKNRTAGQKKVLILFYLLAAYVFLQFLWWTYLLINLNQQLFLTGAPGMNEMTLHKKTWMIFGEGTVFFIFLIIGIITMQRAISKELVLAKRQRNFLLSITHELKTPLSSIRLYLQTLQKRENLKAEHKQEIYHSALSDTDRLNRLIENVLLAARLENNQNILNLEEVNLSDLVADIGRSADNTVGEKHNTTLQIEPGIVLKCDALAVHSMLMNLYENACKYAPAGTEVLISLRQTEKQILLTVADNGPGIPAAEIRNIFLKFYRIGNEDTRSTKGTGLGLYIVSDMARQHQADVVVEANKPSGTRFTIVFKK